MLAIGTKLGQYQILAPLGSGGMGEVFRARDVRLGREVAIKVLPDHFSTNPERLARFEGEARAVAALAHPNILVLHDFASHQGQAYAVTELLEGQTLRQRLASGPLPWRAAVEIGIAIADGLAAAHAKGIIHRDLKPENLFLTHDDRVKILDFGLARTATPPDPNEETGPYIPAQTDPGTVLGTAGYMSPEQVRGQAVDARSDFFSLGSVLYEMVAGRRAFKGESRADLLAAVLNAEPPALSDLGRGPPPDLERTIRHCLEKKPQNRFQSARDLAFALRALIAVSISTQTAQTPPARKHLFTVWIPAALGLVLLVGALIYWLKFTNLPSGPDPPKRAFSSVAVLPFKNTSDDPSESEHLADGISEALITKLAQLQLPDFRVTPWMTAERYKKSAKSLQELAGEMKVDALVTGTLRRSGNRMRVTVSLIEAETGLQSWGEQFDESLSDIFSLEQKIAVAMATRLKGELTGQQQQILALAPSRSVQAYEYYLRGKGEEKHRTKDANDLAFEFYQQAIKTDPDLAEAYIGLGEVQWMRYYMGWQGELRNLQGAEAHFRQALRLKPELASAYSGLIRVHWLRGKSEECLKEGQRVASFQSQDLNTLLARAEAYYFGVLPGKDIPLRQRIAEVDPANQAADLVPSYALAGKYPDAIEAGQISLRRFGATARTHLYIGHAAFALGQLEQAQTRYQASIKIAPDDWMAHIYSGIVYQQQGQPELARRVWTNGKDVVARMLGAYPRNPRLRTHLAIFSGRLGDREALLREEARVLDEEPANGLLLTNLGAARAALGDIDQAVTYLRRGLRLGYVVHRGTFLTLITQGLASFPESADYQAFLQELHDTLYRLQALY